MIVESLPVGINASNCYLVAEDRGCQGVMIDPGADPEVLLDRSSALDLSIAKIFITHAHWDHIGAVGAIKEETSAEICCHEEGLPLYNALVEQLAFVGLKGDPPPPVDLFVRDSQKIIVGGLEFTVLHTPGHSPGSVSYLIEQSLFCGDVIFAGGGVGRTDLPGGSASELKDTISKKILSLPPNTVIYPGHGPSTTVAEEKTFLSFLF